VDLRKNSEEEEAFRVITHAGGLPGAINTKTDCSIWLLLATEDQNLIYL
jgi:hypothetical protein